MKGVKQNPDNPWRNWLFFALRNFAQHSLTQVLHTNASTFHRALDISIYLNPRHLRLNKRQARSMAMRTSFVISLVFGKYDLNFGRLA